MTFHDLASPQTPEDSRSNPPPPRQPTVLCRLASWLGSKLVTRFTSSVLAGTSEHIGSAPTQQLVRPGAQCKAVMTACPGVGESVARDVLSSVPMHELEAIATQRLTDVAQKLTVGNMLEGAAKFVARQGLNTAWLIRGSLSRTWYRRKTIKNAASAVASVGGALAGASAGSLVAPGVGAVVGSFLGASVASTLTEIYARRALQLDQPEVLLLPSAGNASAEEVDPDTGQAVERDDGDDDDDDGGVGGGGDRNEAAEEVVNLVVVVTFAGNVTDDTEEYVIVDYPEVFQPTPAALPQPTSPSPSPSIPK
eukprot:RCo027086